MFANPRRALRPGARAPFGRLAVTGAVALGGCAASARSCPPAAVPAPHIECTYASGGDSTTVRLEPAPDPYRVPELPAGDRFAIKFVYLTTPADLASLRVYAFQLDGGEPVIVHEAEYSTPFAARDGGFTGRQLVYDREGGELAYACSWLER